jgi:hypothetical protein
MSNSGDEDSVMAGEEDELTLCVKGVVRENLRGQ